MDGPEDVTLVKKWAAVEPGSTLHSALRSRSDVFAMTEATHEAVLRPREPGGFSHAERAALATRIARLNEDDELTAHYADMLEALSPDEATASIADPIYRGDAWSRIGAVLSFTDLVATNPKDTEPDDIAALQAAGVSDADIVRLAELNAFLAYQIRLIAGLRLMRGAA